MNVTELIQTAQAQNERDEAGRVARQEEKERVIEASKAADLAALRALLGETADEMEIELTGWHVGKGGEVYNTSYRIRPVAWGGLVDFSAARWTITSPWRFEYYTVSGTFCQQGLGREPGNVWKQSWVSQMLADLQAKYVWTRDRRVEEMCDWLASHVTTDERAVDAYETLMTLAPERAEEWDAALAAWRQRRDERAAAVDAYVDALATWRKSYERELAENQKAVAGAQRALDEEFTRYEVAYAAVGEDDDEPYRETAWAIDPDPEEGGWWSIFDNGNVVLRRLLRPLWVSEAITQTVSKAGEGPWRRAHYVHDAGVTVYYLPWDEYKRHRHLDKTITPLPAEPEPPEWVRDGLTAAERERIIEVTRGMAHVGIPF